MTETMRILIRNLVAGRLPEVRNAVACGIGGFDAIDVLRCPECDALLSADGSCARAQRHQNELRAFKRTRFLSIGPQTTCATSARSIAQDRKRDTRLIARQRLADHTTRVVCCFPRPLDYKGQP